MWIYKERGEVFYKEIAITALAVKFSISGWEAYKLQKSTVDLTNNRMLLKSRKGRTVGISQTLTNWMQTIGNCKQNAMHGTADWVQFIVKAFNPKHF